MMLRRAEDVLPQALDLPLDERTRLAALLMDSIEATENDGDVEAAWLDELTRRLDEHDAGNSVAVPAAVVFSQAWARLERARG
jgi:putative addiction module component (TIGR02574 family)